MECPLSSSHECPGEIYAVLTLALLDTLARGGVLVSSRCSAWSSVAELRTTPHRPVLLELEIPCPLLHYVLTATAQGIARVSTLTDAEDYRITLYTKYHTTTEFMRRAVLESRCPHVSGVGVRPLRAPVTELVRTLISCVRRRHCSMCESTLPLRVTASLRDLAVVVGREVFHIDISPVPTTVTDLVLVGEEIVKTVGSEYKVLEVRRGEEPPLHVTTQFAVVRRRIGLGSETYFCRVDTRYEEKGDVCVVTEVTVELYPVPEPLYRIITERTLL